MTVLRFDPFQEFDRLSRQMLGGGRGPRSMPMEAYRRGDQFFIHLDLPGVKPDDVQLTVERNVVAVRAERRPLWQEGDEVLVDETPPGPLRPAAVPRGQPGRGPAGGQLRPGHPDPDDPGRRAGQAPPHPGQRQVPGSPAGRDHRWRTGVDRRAAGQQRRCAVSEPVARPGT